MSRLVRMFAVLVSLLPLAHLFAAAATPQPSSDPNKALAFLPNQGQSDRLTKFQAYGTGFIVSITQQEAVLTLASPPRAPAADSPAGLRSHPNPKSDWSGPKQDSFRMHFVGGGGQPAVTVSNQLKTLSNFVAGSDQTKWATNVQSYGRVQYSNIYNGIDIAYYGDATTLKYDIIVNAGADPKQIRLQFQGATDTTLDANGNLVIKTAVGSMTHFQPYLYQIVNGKALEIHGSYVLSSNKQVSFLIGAYDKTRPLIIDPVISYSTYFGVPANVANAAAADAAGNLYMVGVTAQSWSGGTGNWYPYLYCSNGCVQVTKFSSTGQPLVNTFISCNECFYPIADYTAIYAVTLDSTGSNLYLVGRESSYGYADPSEPDNLPHAVWPVVNSVERYKGPAGNYSANGIITKLDTANLSIQFSRYLGGSAYTGDGFGADYITSVAYDSSPGNESIVLTGLTKSSDFPTTSTAIQGTHSSGYYDSFLTRLRTDGSPVYSTFLSGGCTQYVGLDGAGNIYLSGWAGYYNNWTNTSLFNATCPGANPFRTYSGTATMRDTYIARFSSSGTLAANTYLGFRGTPYGMAVSEAGDIWIVGAGSGSTTVLPQVNALSWTQTHPPEAGVNEWFVTKSALSPAAFAFAFSSWLGCPTNLSPPSIALGPSERVYIAVGIRPTDYSTGCKDLPVKGGLPWIYSWNPPDLHPGTVNEEAFILGLDSSYQQTYGGYFGGSNGSSVGAIATDTSGNIYLVGGTTSADFIVSTTAYEKLLANAYTNTLPHGNAYALKLVLPGTDQSTIVVSPASTSMRCADVTLNTKITITATVNHTVNGTPTGWIVFRDITPGSTFVTYVALGSQWYPTASYAIPITVFAPPGITHTITAEYTGDPQFAPQPPSPSRAEVTVTNPCPTFTTATETPDPASNMAAPFVIAEVHSVFEPRPAGTVTFNALGTVYGPFDASRDGSRSPYAWAQTGLLPLLSGEYTVSTSYVPYDSTLYLPSGATPLGVTFIGVTASAAASSMKITDPPPQLTACLSGTSEGQAPAGTVFFTVDQPNNPSFASAPIKRFSSGQYCGCVSSPRTADCEAYTSTSLQIGSNNIVAKYSGSGVYPPAYSPPVPLFVGSPLATTTTLLASTTLTPSDQPVSFTARVAPIGASGSPSGTLTLWDGGVVLATGNIVGGSVTLTTNLVMGMHNITAHYNGDPSFDASMSAPVFVNAIGNVSTLMTVAMGSMLQSSVLLADVKINGTITRHLASNDVASHFTAKLKATGGYKFSECAYGTNGDCSDTGSYVVVIANGNAGAIRARDGSKIRLPSQVAQTLRGVLVPVMSRVANWWDPATTITVAGSGTIGTDAAIGLQLKTTAALPGTVPQPPTNVWISAATNQILQVDYGRWAADNKSTGVNTTVLFSDFRQVDDGRGNHLKIPFRQDESVQGLSTLTIQFDTDGVAVNRGLSDAEFSICTILGGCQ